MTSHLPSLAFRYSVLLIAVLVFVSCDNKTPESSDTDSTSVSDQAINNVVVELYPGAGYTLLHSADEKLRAEVTTGAMHSSVDGTKFQFVAPLENGEVKYRLIKTGSEAVSRDGAFIVDMPPAATWDMESTSEKSLWIARYGDVVVEIQDKGDGAAVASWRNESLGESLVSNINGDAGYIEWSGHTLRGIGALSETESGLLRDISTSSLSRSLTMAGLDLGCIEPTAEMPAHLHAALLFPWQMILKYEIPDRFPVINHFVSQSVCSFMGAPVPAQDRPEHAAVFWDHDHIIPSTLFHFPFDGDGQMEPVK